ncbi:MAG TPA: hypothetical protein VFV31_13055 [Chitinophagaceae bacterium]|nr:hypothetical protein [Chitinophagaceae bacterium]
MIEQLNEKLYNLYKVECIIDGGDIEEIQALTGYSRFTIWQYLSGKGKSISTADEIYRSALDIAEQRRARIEKEDILNDYSKS